MPAGLGRGSKPPAAHEAWIRLLHAIEQRDIAEQRAAEARERWDHALVEAAGHWDMEDIAKLLGTSKGNAYGRAHNARHRIFKREWDAQKSDS